jgi:hypothetical protein
MREAFEKSRQTATIRACMITAWLMKRRHYSRISMNPHSPEHEVFVHDVHQTDFMDTRFFRRIPRVKLDSEADLRGTLGARVDLACVAVVGRGGNEGLQELRATRALVLVWLFAVSFITLDIGEALSASHHKDVRVHRNTAAAAGHDHGVALNATRHAAASRSDKSRDAVTSVPLPIERPAAASLPPDLGAAKQAIELIRKSKWKDAAALSASINDPAAQKLIEWALLRSSDSPAGFEHYAAFLTTNPDWPGALLRRRAEARLWQERRDGNTVRRFVGNEPVSSVGRLALARVLMNEGNRDGAAREVRAVWQLAELSAEMESAVLDTFTDMLSRADHVARMDRRIGAKDFGAAMRAAKRAGDDRVAIVKACIAAEAKSAKRVERCLMRSAPRRARTWDTYCAAYTG